MFNASPFHLEILLGNTDLPFWRLNTPSLGGIHHCCLHTLVFLLPNPAEQNKVCELCL